MHILKLVYSGCEWLRGPCNWKNILQNLFTVDTSGFQEICILVYLLLLGTSWSLHGYTGYELQDGTHIPAKNLINI